MQSAYDNKIIEKPFHISYEKGTFELPKRLGDKNYATSFNVLRKWFLVRTDILFLE